MSERWFPASVTRLAGLDGRRGESALLPRGEWSFGDLVTGVVRDVSGARREIESTTGRAIEVVAGDVVVGALGTRAATVETVGDWRAVGDDLVLHALTSAGVFGRCTSRAVMLPPLLSLRYAGHVLLGGRTANMRDFVPAPPALRFALPTVLVIGTSMSAGKTTTAKTVIRRLKRMGLRVAGAKLSGVGRYRDILAMDDAGADAVLDFVDAGLPSTVCPRPQFEQALRGLLARIAGTGADVLVAEAGASPLEPYNADTVVRELGENVKCVVLCASDPYAVVGVTSAFGLEPQLVAGRATSTDAAVALVRSLTGVEALDLLDPRWHPQLDDLLAAHLRLGERTEAHGTVERLGSTGAGNP